MGIKAVGAHGEPGFLRSPPGAGAMPPGSGAAVAIFFSAVGQARAAIAFEEKNKKMELEDEVEELKASLNKETEPEPEPKAVANPWGRAGKPGHQRVAPPPAKKARFQPARGAVDAAAAVM